MLRFLVFTALIVIVIGLLLRSDSPSAPFPGNSIYSNNPRDRRIRLFLDTLILGFCGLVAGFIVWGLYALCRVMIRGRS